MICAHMIYISLKIQNVVFLIKKKIILLKIGNFKIIKKQHSKQTIFILEAILKKSITYYYSSGDFFTKPVGTKNHNSCR